MTEETCRAIASVPPSIATDHIPQWALPVYRIELVRERDLELPAVCGPDDAAAIAWRYLERFDREAFIVMCLSTSNRVIGIHMAHLGTLSACAVAAREVFKVAIAGNTAAIICAHNHPSGNLEPSREDIRITRQLAEAGRVLAIPLHDSLIVSCQGFTSLAERGLL